MASLFTRKLSVVLIILLLSAYASVAADPKDKLERLMEFYAVNDNFNGTVLVMRKGSVLLDKGYGYQDVARKIKNTEKTIFQIGSITMQFTAELLLLLDSQGKLSLDDKVTKYLPGFPNGDKISLKNLLTHTSGLYDYSTDTAIMNNPTRAFPLDSLIGIFKNKPLLFEPGEKFEISNSNYALLGYIIEKMTRWNYEDQLKYKVLHGSGMYHSGFDFTDLVSENKATGYYSITKDTAREAPIMDSSLSYAAGSLYSSADDLYKWHRSLSDHIFLPKDWQEIAYTPFKNHYAFGWEVETMFQRRFVEQTGNASGFSSLIMRQENDDICIILLQNKMQPADVNKVIANNIVKCLYDKDYKIPVTINMVAEKEEILKSKAKEKDIDIDEEPVAESKKVVQEKIDLYAQYTGEYVFDSTFSIVITHKGKDFYAQATGQEPFRIIPESNTLFYKAGVDARLEFVKDENGKIVKLILHEHRRDEQGIRK